MTLLEVLTVIDYLEAIAYVLFPAFIVGAVLLMVIYSLSRRTYE